MCCRYSNIRGLQSATRQTILVNRSLPKFRVRSTTTICLLPPANEVWRKVIFSVTCVKNSVHRRGGSPSVQTHTPWKQTPPGSIPPPEADTPRRRNLPLEADQPPARKQIPLGNRHPPESRYPPEANHPPPVHVGRYGMELERNLVAWCCCRVLSLCVKSNIGSHATQYRWYKKSVSLLPSANGHSVSGLLCA